MSKGTIKKNKTLTNIIIIIIIGVVIIIIIIIIIIAPIVSFWFILASYDICEQVFICYLEKIETY